MTTSKKSLGNSNCLRTPRSPRRCSRCDRSLVGEIAHLPIYQRGIFCAAHCPVCRPDQADRQPEPLELFDEGACPCNHFRTTYTSESPANVTLGELPAICVFSDIAVRRRLSVQYARFGPGWPDKPCCSAIRLSTLRTSMKSWAQLGDLGSSGPGQFLLDHEQGHYRELMTGSGTGLGRAAAGGRPSR
jgi:hypothetical protein